MDNLKMQSKNILGENIEFIASRFPNVITETKDENGNLTRKIDFELLMQELSGDIVEGNKERYQLTWPGKKEAILNANTPINKTLRPVIEDSVDFENTENLYIEGDNLEVLKLLQESYLGKIKFIYIDPPYNTGNDFIYLDKFNENLDEYLTESGQVDEEGNKFFQNTESNGRFHSDWMTMIYPRLKLARNLLSDDGVIFISIDNNEIKNLRSICDEVFGRNNFIEEIIWKNKYGAGAKTKGFISVHEYILCYSKKPILNLTSELSEDEKKKYIKKDEKYDVLGGYRTQPLMTKSLGDRPNLVYPIYYNGEEIWPNKQWVWSKERMERSIENNDVEIKKRSDGTYSVESKKYIKDENGDMRRGKPGSILNGPFTQEGTNEIRSVFDNKTPFEFTKPSNLIKYLISLQVNDINDKECIVLDFFSGSGTTAHAVMKLNSEDRGKRKYIMVQAPEKTEEKSQAYKLGYKTICDIGRNRIKGISKNIKEETNADIDYGFRVYKVDSTNMKDTYYNIEQITQASLFETQSNIKEDRTPEDLLTQVILDLGLELSLKIEEKNINGKKVFYVDEDSLVACFDEGVDKDLATIIAKDMPMKVVFRDSCFINDSEKENIKEIFKKYSPDTDIKVL